MRSIMFLLSIFPLCIAIWDALGADFNGDGTDNIGIFRPEAGLWSVRGVTRLYFGSKQDYPVPGDYLDDGENRALIAVFRPNNGLWAIRGVTRLYFGGSADIPVPGNYSGSAPPGKMNIAVFRASTGLWAIRGLTRCYHGTYSDIPLRATDFNGDGSDDIGIYRPSNSLWSVRGITQIYFGKEGDLPVPGDYPGDSSATGAIAVYRQWAGIWAIKGVTRIYFGDPRKAPIPANYTGSPPAENIDIAVFRDSNGLWAIRGLTRIYYGTEGDLPISNCNPMARAADILFEANLVGGCRMVSYKERGIRHWEWDAPSTWTRNVKGSNGDTILFTGEAGCYPEMESGEVELNLYINGAFVTRAKDSGLDAAAQIWGTLRVDEDGAAWYEESSY